MSKPKDKQKSEKPPVSQFTGEVLENVESAKEAIDQIDSEIKRLKNSKKEIKQVYRLDEKEVVFQKRFFLKLYKNDYERYMKHMSPITVKLLHFFYWNMNHKDNTVMIDGSYPTQTEIADHSGLSLNSVKSAMNELKKSNFIMIVRGRQNPKIYLNPALVEDSMTQKEIHYMFMDNSGD